MTTPANVFQTDARRRTTMPSVDGDVLVLLLVEPDHDKV